MAAITVGLLGPNQNIIDFTPTEEIVEEIILVEEEPLNLTAQSACVFDLVKNEWLFEKKSNAQLPLASLAKLMTAVVAKENLLSGTVIEITKESLLQNGDSGLNIGERWTLAEIIDVMLISSSNDASFAIANSLKKGQEIDNSEFIKLMNNKAHELNLAQTYFLNSNGLDISDELAGAYGSCADVTTLMKYIFEKYPELIEVTSKEFINVDGREFENTNKLLSKIPVLYGGKTGFDDLAGGNLTVIIDKGLNHPMIITVLGSTIDDRFTDVEILYDRFTKSLE